MKKTIITLLLFILTFGIFAETGYNKQRWYTKNQSVELNFETEKGTDKIWETTRAEKKPILGKETIIYYHFYQEYLGAISYILPLEKTEILKKKLKDLIYEKQTLTLSLDKWLTGYQEQGFIEEVNDPILDINHIMARLSLDLELNGYEQAENFGKYLMNGYIRIYDYNDDTRLYLYENFITDYTLVVYVPHEQDY